MSWRLLLAVLAAGILSACATSQFRAEVTVRHQLETSPISGKVFVIDKNASQVQSLAAKQYADELASQLRLQGLIQQEDPKKADWLVRFGYRIDDGKTVSSNVPVWGTIGYSMGYRRVYTGAGVVLVPQYYPETGVVGTQSVNNTVYQREFTLDIFDRQELDQGKFAKLFEGRAVNRSTQDVLDPAMPYLIQSLFMPFPGPSGQTRNISIPLADK